MVNLIFKGGVKSISISYYYKGVENVILNVINVNVVEG